MWPGSWKTRVKKEINIKGLYVSGNSDEKYQTFGMDNWKSGFEIYQNFIAKVQIGGPFYMAALKQFWYYK